MYLVSFLSTQISIFAKKRVYQYDKKIRRLKATYYQFASISVF